MTNSERKSILWRRADELHAKVNQMTSEQARLVAIGREPPDFLRQKETLIEEADMVLLELEKLYDAGSGEPGRV